MLNDFGIHKHHNHTTLLNLTILRLWGLAEEKESKVWIISSFQRFYAGLAKDTPSNLAAVHRAALLTNILKAYK